MSDDAPCCGACAHALEVQARGGPRPATAPLVHVPVVGGVPHGIMIVVIAGHELGRMIAIDKTELVVGRTSGVDVRIDDPVISRRQCRFVFRDDHAYVEDLGSTCGTFVDDARIRSSTPLRDGQRVLVGNTIFVVRQTSG